MMRHAWLLALWAAGCAHLPQPSAAGDEQPALSQAQLLEIAAAAEQSGDGLRAQQYLLAARAGGADAQRTLPWLLRLYVRDGQYRSAIDAATSELELHPDALPLRMLLASLYEAMQLPEAATDQYQRVLQRRPDDALAHYALASLLQRGGLDAARADAHYRAYLALEPDGPDAADARAHLLQELP